LNYYRRYVGDYLRDTVRLSMLEHGAYNLMLDYYYADEQPLPLERDELYVMVRAMSSADRKAVDKVLSLYFSEAEDGYRHKRADREIQVAQRTIAKQRLSGSESAAKRWSTDESTDRSTHNSTDGLTDGLSGGLKDAYADTTTNHQPPTTSLQPPATSKTTSPPAGFLAFWSVYPSRRRVGRRKCLEVWVKQRLEAKATDICLHVEAMKLTPDWRKDGGQFIPTSQTYLNQGRFEDGTPEPPERRLAI
jgi:uncharacterized protein YdaU (DUF1376 family)